MNLLNKLNLLKLVGPALLVPLALFLYLLPVEAIGGADISLSSQGAAGPDIEISFDSKRLAVVYYKQDSTAGTGAVYLKSATANPANGGAGWVTSTFLGLGSNPQVAFKRTVTNTVYVVWVNSTDTAIQAARCTLNLTAPPTCGPSSNVRSLQVGTLGSPDIVVDGNNVLHVAWQNGDIIETARSNNADSVGGWSSPAVPGRCAGNRAGAPVLGWTSTNDKLHLAFLCGAAAPTPTSIEYRRSDTGSHAWNESVNTQFTIGNTLGDDISIIHSKLGNLALHASSSQVSLAWDGLRTDLLQQFSLMYVVSTNEGVNWGTVIYVPSGIAASGNPSGENKLSTTSTLPPQEYGLRPNLVINGAGGNAAVVWQQKLNDGVCQDADNGSSDVHFVNPQNSSASLDTLEHTNKKHYSIDPDLAIGSGGTRHFVFMKDINAENCTGGDASKYAIYYRGPFTEQANDKVETSPGQTFLPFLRK
jgi:hypothetical protein